MHIVDTEVALVSDVYDYGGRLDAVAIIDGQLAVCDWKSGNGIYAESLLQLAAYAHLLRANPVYLIERGLVSRGEAAGRVHVDHYLCNFDRDTGNFTHHPFVDLDYAWAQFALLRQAYGLDSSIKKYLKGK